MHGAEECAGNVQQLCVANHRPSPSWWEFVQCQNYEGSEKIGNDEIARKCATVAGFDWDTSQAGGCAGLDGKGTEGVKLLKGSVALSQKLGIKWVAISKVQRRIMADAERISTEKVAQCSLAATKFAFTTERGKNARYVILRVRMGL